MKTASSNLKAMLIGATAPSFLRMADLFTFTLASGTVIRWTSFDNDVKLSGNTFFSLHLSPTTGAHISGAAIRRGPITERAGVETSPLQIYIASQVAIVLGLTIHQAVVAGLFNGATCVLQRAFWKVGATADSMQNPDNSEAIGKDGTWTATEGVIVFSGWVSGCSVGRSLCVFTISSLFERLNIPSPRITLMPGCRHTLFDTGCTLLASSFATTSTVSAGSTQNAIRHPIATAHPADYYSLGRVLFTNGQNQGLWRMIQTGDVSGVTRNFSQQVLDFKPLGYWRLNDAGPTTVADTSGNAHNGTAHGALTFSQGGALTGDATAKSISFNGGYISLPMPAPPNFSAGISFSFMFQLKTGAAASQPLGIFDTAPSEINTLRNYNPEGPGPGMEWRNERPLVPFAQPSIAAWHLGCVVFRGQNAVDWWIDGVFQSSLTSEGTGDIDWTNPMNIGKLVNLDGSDLGFFSGFMSEFAIYNFPLSQYHVNALYSAAITAPATSIAQFILVQPLPNVPATGDAFTVYPGCNKTMQMCRDKFNNLIHYGGQPFVPQPEQAL